jgi:predicted metal-dependent RNase
VQDQALFDHPIAPNSNRSSHSDIIIVRPVEQVLSVVAQEHLLHSRESDAIMINPSNLLVNNFELAETPGNSLIHPVQYDKEGTVGKLIQHGQESG